jgi:adenine phosphoribosyltransferase
VAVKPDSGLTSGAGGAAGDVNPVSGVNPVTVGGVNVDQLKTKIRHVPDFPKAGILFYDITTLLQDPSGFHMAVDSLEVPFRGEGIDLVVGIESRGFIFGAAVADRVGAGFAPVRKRGKLPSTTVSASYSLEYGADVLEIHSDAVKKGQRVLIVDDLLATGGTARATAELVRRLGGDVHALAFLIELVGLEGRAKLGGERVHTVLKY